MIILETQEAFDDWASRMDEEIENLKKTVPSGLGSVMDYSVESLVDVEKYLLSRYPSLNELKEDRINYERFARYVGEVDIRHSSSRWCIDLEDEEFAFFGSPVVGRPESGQYSPFTLVTACLDRRTGVYLEMVINNRIKVRN